MVTAGADRVIRDIFDGGLGWNLGGRDSAPSLVVSTVDFVAARAEVSGGLAIFAGGLLHGAAGRLCEVHLTRGLLC